MKNLKVSFVLLSTLFFLGCGLNMSQPELAVNLNEYYFEVYEQYKAIKATSTQPAQDYLNEYVAPKLDEAKEYIHSYNQAILKGIDAPEVKRKIVQLIVAAERQLEGL